MSNSLSLSHQKKSLISTPLQILNQTLCRLRELKFNFPGKMFALRLHHQALQNVNVSRKKNSSLVPLKKSSVAALELSLLANSLRLSVLLAPERPLCLTTFQADRSQRNLRNQAISRSTELQLSRSKDSPHSLVTCSKTIFCSNR